MSSGQEGNGNPNGAASNGVNGDSKGKEEKTEFSPNEPYKENKETQPSGATGESAVTANQEPELTPQEAAGCLSWLLYTWVNPLLERGSERVEKEEPLLKEDLLPMPPWERPTENAKTLRIYWEEELRLHPTEPKLGRALRRAFGTRVMVGGLFRFLSDGCAFAAPFLLQQLIKWLSDPNRNDWAGFIWAIALTVSNLFMSNFLNASSHHTMTAFQQMSGAMTILIYDAVLRHPVQHDVGKLTSAHVTDTGKFVEMAIFVHGLWVSPILVVAAVIALYFFIGWAGLIAVAVTFLFIPMQAIVMGFVATTTRTRLGYAKMTIGSINEALQGIRICKFMNWETPFAQRISQARQREVDILKTTYIWKMIAQVLAVSMPNVVLFVLFVIANYLGGSIDAKSVFPALAMISVIRVPLMFIPMSISKMFEMQFSIDRMQSVLMGQRKEKVVRREDMGDVAARISEVTVQKDDGSKLMTFPEVNIPRGKLTAVVGPTGSGKSTLAMALLGEARMNDEAIVEHGCTCGFVSQEPWLMNATVQHNITMGAAFDQSRYDRVLEASELMTDMDQLPDGDQTEVGERGITLSGGQKQRISLARAAYAEREMIVMDDPLSAVDPQVRKGLFFECICKLMEGRTRVLVTHQTQFLPHVDNIIHINDKHELQFQGNYKDYVAQGFVQEEAAQTHGTNSETPSPTAASPTAKGKPALKEGEKAPAVPAPQALFTKEDQALGEVKWSVYGWYVRIGGLGWFTLSVITLLLWRASTIMVDLWLAWWSGRQRAFGRSYKTEEYMLYYGICIIISIIILIIRFEMFRRMMINIAGGCHAVLTNSLLHAPISFYDTTPMGRILNRFTKDIDVMDGRLPDGFLQMSSMAVMILGMLVLVGVSTPYVIIIFPVLMVIFRLMYNYYCRTLRGLKRLEGSFRSPFMAIMNETVGGLAIIRAYGCVEDFSRVHSERSENASHPVYNNRSCQRWLMARTETLGSVIIFFTSIFACIASVVGNASWNTRNSAGITALSITYAMAATNNITWLTRTGADVEADMSSAERVKEYCDGIPQEKVVVYDAEHPAPPEDWPTKGEIEFDSVQLRYRDNLPLVLKDVSFSIRGGEKIGVVGRTGSGKSTVMLSLFRMIELCGGMIRVDGLDISQLQMSDLRKKITIIPQDPVLFAGTVRSNLDPFDFHTDEKIWNILDKVGLKKRVEEGLKEKNPLGDKKGKPGAPGGGPAAAPAAGANAPPAKPSEDASAEKEKPTLLARVTEKGANFSVGERQLMCLARALLKKSQILLLDEATASVDYEADAMIQRCIRTEFSECTVLTIAHRLATVIDADRVLVLDDGRVAEFDEPYHLLQNQDSIFRSMAVPLGETQFNDLVAKAQAQSEKKKSLPA